MYLNELLQYLKIEHFLTLGYYYMCISTYVQKLI